MWLPNVIHFFLLPLLIFLLPLLIFPSTLQTIISNIINNCKVVHFMKSSFKVFKYRYNNYDYCNVTFDIAKTSFIVFNVE